MPVGGPTSTGAELPGRSGSLRASRRSHTADPRRAVERKEERIYHRHRAPLPLSSCRFYAPGMMPSLPTPRHRANRCDVNWPLIGLKGFRNERCLFFLRIEEIFRVIIVYKKFAKFLLSCSKFDL